MLQWGGWIVGVPAAILSALLIVDRIEARGVSAQELRQRVTNVEVQEQYLNKGLSDYQANTERGLADISRKLDNLRVEVCEGRGGHWRNGECK